MKKTVIKTCSCFLEKAVWFVYLPKLYPYWLYLSNSYDGKDSKDIFIMEHQTAIYSVNDEIVHHMTMISYCVNCMKFQAVQENSIQALNNSQM